MELDDLRRRWQQAAPTEPRAATDAAKLERLVSRRSQNAVAKMRRNAWLEIALAVAFVLGAGASLAAGVTGQVRAMLVYLVVVCLLSGFYYHRKLTVLNRLADFSGAVHEHVARQLAGLRGLVRLYYRVTLWSTPVAMGICIFYIAGEIMQRLSGRALWVALGITGLIYLLFSVLMFFGIRWFTRWYLQTLYGQHLDYLETSLRELSAEE
ncbi:hypothetical protein [Hymenobacter latericus]|uniref:hypothetical protein n=1 Tax=Hymenobacter sp. YIM 151858-1 TaxID=2987688 RepID=UPI002226398C|nr:hypothetical protein [Hymenobacter sp. YIM 151858-1]UYZ57423.1 hypothetical protein OIS50_10105 [Hymenobacter sp. YIM 151858-1]